MWLRLDRRVVPAAPENKNEIKQGVVMRFKFANRVAAWAFTVASAAMLPAFADGAKRPMTLVVMVDGLRADAVIYLPKRAHRGDELAIAIALLAA